MIITKDNVATLQNDVTGQKQEIEEIKENVTKVDNLESIVQETVEKVEDIDHKVSCTIFIQRIIKQNKVISNYTIHFTNGHILWNFHLLPFFQYIIADS